MATISSAISGQRRIPQRLQRASSHRTQLLHALDRQAADQQIARVATAVVHDGVVVSILFVVHCRRISDRRAREGDDVAGVGHCGT